MWSRCGVGLVTVVWAGGCIPYYDFSPCRDTEPCYRADATAGGDLGEVAADVADDRGSDATGEVAAADADVGVADASGGGDAVEAPDAVVCAPGSADCDGIAANGCETDTRTSSMHCGACGVVCAAPMHGSSQCAMGRCEVACDAGHARTGDGCALITAPRLVAPLSPHTVTSQMPRLRWALGAGSDGVRVELCRERACTTVVHRFDAMGTSALTPMTLTPGAWFWRAVGMQGAAVGVAYSATWEFFVGHRSAPVNTAWGQTTDVNGDGYADLVFAAGGTIYTYAGSPRGLATMPTMLTPVPGQAVQGLSARGGDVDGDGFGDLLVHVAAPGDVLGVALLYRGGAGGVGGTAARTYDPATSRPSLLGDVNGDGYGDLGLSDAIVFGAVGGPPDMRTTPPINDRVIFPAGDLNGDGFADLFHCTLMRLRANCTAATGTAAGTPGTFGVALDVTGWPRMLFDADGDGRSDLAALLPTASPPGQWVGYGGSAAPTLALVSEAAALIDTGVGDLDRDGFGETALIALNAAGMFAGEQIVFGNRERRWDARRMLNVSPGVPFSNFANHFAIGDTDGDGVDEFAAVDQPLRLVHVFGAGASTLGTPMRAVPFPLAATALVYSL